jgi:hypothetical protein
LGCGHRPSRRRSGARENEGRNRAPARCAFEDFRETRAIEHLQHHAVGDRGRGQRQPYYDSGLCHDLFSTAGSNCADDSQAGSAEPGSDSASDWHCDVDAFCSPTKARASSKTFAFADRSACGIHSSHCHTSIDTGSPDHFLNAGSRAADNSSPHLAASAEHAGSSPNFNPTGRGHRETLAATKSRAKTGDSSSRHSATAGRNSASKCGLD